MADEVMDWDSAYRGEPQPALAAEGYTVVGVDLTPTGLRSLPRPPRSAG